MLVNLWHQRVAYKNIDFGPIYFGGDQWLKKAAYVSGVRIVSQAKIIADLFCTASVTV